MSNRLHAPGSKRSPIVYNVYYDLAKRGLTVQEVAKERGIEEGTVRSWARSWGGWPAFVAKVREDHKVVEDAVSQAFKNVLGYDPAEEAKGE